MKKILSCLFIFVLSFSLISCNRNDDGDDDGGKGPTGTKHIVQFYAEDTLYETLKIEDGKTIGAYTVANSTLARFKSVSWGDASKDEADLATHLVKGTLKLYATLKEAIYNSYFATSEVVS